MKTIYKKLITYIRATRPEIFIMDWSMIWVAFFLVETEFNWQFISTILILMLISGPFIHGAVDMINDYFDYRIDVKNRRSDKLLVSGEMTSHEMLVLTGILLISGNILALILLPGLLAFLMILSTILGVLYSVPPVRFREFYPLSAILPSVPYFLVSIIAWFIFTGNIGDKAILVGSILAVNMFLGLTLKDIYDSRGDLEYGVKSIVYWLNPVRARYFVVLVAFLSPSLIVIGVAAHIFNSIALTIAFFQYIITIFSSNYIISGEWTPRLSYKVFYPAYRLGCFILLSLLGSFKLI